MASYSYGLAKGLREPCSPYREAYYFGAPLNEPSASGWNCLPELVGQTTSFDLSSITKGREVLVALLKVQNTPEGSLSFKAEWYRNRDNALLFTQPWSYTARYGGWTYFYAYLGYVDWEISENGGHRVEITVSGALSYFKVIQFTISGIPKEVEPEPIPTGAMGWISERFAIASGFFYQVYLETLDWVYPFWLISDFFYELAQTCADLSWDFADFSVWVQVITDRITGVLSWDTVWSYILDRVPNLETIRDWFYNITGNILSVVYDWWAETSSTVLDWIDEAKQWARLWIDYLQGQVDELRVMIQDIPGAIPDLSNILDWFTDWPGHIHTYIDTWWTSTMGDVQGLIDSSLTTWFPFYDDLVGLWGGIKEFFTDPEDWLYKSLDRIIERFW
uniref:Uncharacterized protein n=1 Tax=viral metagenome TaxID=1070528 RepID=A0A6M3LUN3_9ZZZZ